jgi:hypothetical protein
MICICAALATLSLTLVGIYFALGNGVLRETSSYKELHK